ncbi:retrovirus-related pol polyprotein from transposon TNT 1-94 [Tanacetum coccineum]|uniref:Retrovirus-related pol polyprotein from transposon TNT 1-94 n=1 Tax=Tanacetum coccineum TaxID=301880 RepID=A0ABQ5J5P6_9ASTR
MQADLSSLKSDTSEIKSMMTKIYQAFKADIEEPPSHTEGEHVTKEDDTKKVESDKAEEEPTRAVPISTISPLTDPILEIHVPQQTTPVTQGEGKGIATDEQLKSTKKLVPASKVVREDLDEPIRVPYMINEKMHYLTNDEINSHLEKEDKIKKAAEEAKRLEITNTKVIKIVQEEAEKIGIDPKKIISAKAGEKFKKAQDAKIQVHKRQHTKKAKRLMELNKKRFEQYKWTISSRLNPEPNTDVKIHPNSKPAVLTVYKNNDKRNFQRYERLKKIPEELRIQSALPAPEQAPSQSSGRKRKHMELEPEIKLPGLECNRSLPKGVPFMNNMVIEEPEYGIFFTDVFVMASMIKTLENARFSLNLKKLIDEHADQEKLQSKRVKLEVVGINGEALSEMARWIGCGIGEFPFTYLGLSIGENMLVSNCGKIQKRLADWKAKSMSFGGHLTLIGEEIDEVGLELSSSWGGVLANRKDTLFWVDRRKDSSVSEKGHGIMACGGGFGIGLERFGVGDKWRWSLSEDGEFMTKNLSRMVEDKILYTDRGGQETIWNKLVLKKVNIFVWIALNERLPVRDALDKRGIDLDLVFVQVATTVRKRVLIA